MIKTTIPSVAFVTGLLASTLFWITPVLAQHGDQHKPMPNVMEYLERLDRPERDQDQKPGLVVEALGLKPGMSVADLGSGSGYFTMRFVEAVTETGKVYAIDVEPAALKYVEERLARMNRHYQVEFILAQPDNPRLPIKSVDLIFVCNTFHHLKDRTIYFRNVRSALKSGGRIVIVDYYHDERSGDLGFPKKHLVARETVLKEFNAAGYKLVNEHNFLPKQYFLEFAIH
jgi:ubiquinone/menaquinone biosynthesis C-methylase UbiE